MTMPNSLQETDACLTVVRQRRTNNNDVKERSAKPRPQEAREKHKWKKIGYIHGQLLFAVIWCAIAWSRGLA
jgi:hypothetical protein